MAPFQIILLLLLVRLPRSLDSAQGPGALAQPLSIAGRHLPAAAVLALFIGSQAALVLFVLWRTRRALKTLNNPSASGVALLARTDWLFQWARWATIALTALHLYVLGLPGIVTSWLVGSRALGRIPLLAEALYIAPALLAWITFWGAAYFVERANRERTLAFRLAAGLPAHPMPSLLQFLSMQIRHNLYILVPVGAATMIEELSGVLDAYFPRGGELAVFVALLCLLLAMPWFITQAWRTVPLTGPLRARLDGVARQYHLRFRNILVWKTHNAISNAAILGYLPFSRYFLMTDALLETLSDQQLEAVFAHEVGHGVHRHIWWYLGGFFAAFFLSAGLTDLAVGHLPAGILGALGGADRLGVVASLVAIGLFIMVGFPFVSHRFEHQADWFAAQHMARRRAEHPKVPAVPASLLAGDVAGLSLEDSAAALAISGSTLSGVRDSALGESQHGGTAPAEDAPGAFAQNADGPTKLPESGSLAQGAEVFISSLEAIADLAHKARNKKGWMHPSIFSRIELLRTLAANPPAQRAFRRRMIASRLYLLAVVLAAIALTAYGELHTGPQPGPATQPASQVSPR